MDIDKLSKEKDYSEEIIKIIKTNHLPVAVWGLGGEISFIIENLRNYNLTIDFIVDNNIEKNGMIFKDIPVVSFRELKNRCDDINILIGVVTKRYVADITNQIKLDGKYNKVFFFEMFYPIGEIAKKIIIGNKNSIESVFDILDDKKSKQIYEKKITYLVNKKEGTFEKIMDSEGEQYFDKIIELSNLDGLFIDGGAFHGENTDELYKRFSETKVHTACVDADKNNVDYMKKKYAKTHNNHNIRIYYGALEKGNGEIYFENSGDRGGQVSKDEKGIVIPSIGIDDEFVKEKVSYIKLDIEGAEYDCLMGAQNIIKRDKPLLAISIYHSIEDHWRIPLLIKTMRPDYKIYLRHYHYTGIETIIYAI